jgi:thiol-disulfide isomerase/thioredoxin
MKKLAVLLILAGIVVLVVRSRRPGGPQPSGQVIDFELKDLDGKTVSSADVRKGKVLVLKFGATWCGWCNKQIPQLNGVVAHYGNKVAVLDVDVEEPADKVRRHNASYKTTYMTVLDPDGAVADSYGVRGIPVVLVVDPAGKIIYRGNYTPSRRLQEIIDPLLAGRE